MTHWHWVLKQLGKTLWIRALLFCLIGLAAALAGYLVKNMVPGDVARGFGAEALDTVLTIFASSMLAVTTFSLNILVSAFSSAATGATPRAYSLLLEDHTSQNAISTFIGGFLFSLVGIIALKTELYGDGGRVVLLAVTLVMIVFVIGVMLRWIHHLTVFGRLNDTIRRIERAAAQSITARIERPYLGGQPIPSSGLPDGLTPITHPDIGYVKNVDVAELTSIAERLDCQFYVSAVPGQFNDSVRPVLHSSNPLSDSDLADVREVLLIGKDRSFDNDPRYGLVILAEIASRALSPAVNDPGTAIDIISTGVRLLAPWMKSMAEEGPIKPTHERLFVPRLRLDEMLDDLFTPIARDGASNIAVGISLQKAYASLAALGSGCCDDALRRLAQASMTRAMEALNSDDDRQRLGRHLFADQAG